MMSSSISRAPSKGRDRSNCISRAPRLIGRLPAALKFAKRNGSTSTNCRMSFQTTSERSSNARLMLEKSAAHDVCYVAKFNKKLPGEDNGDTECPANSLGRNGHADPAQDRRIS